MAGLTAKARSGMLTTKQITEIVQYEREGLDSTTPELNGADYPGARY